MNTTRGMSERRGENIQQEGKEKPKEDLEVGRKEGGVWDREERERVREGGGDPTPKTRYTVGSPPSVDRITGTFISDNSHQ